MIEESGFEPLLKIMTADEDETSDHNSRLSADVVWSPLWHGTFLINKLKASDLFVLKREMPGITMVITHK
jgi:hypothetical protein